MPLSKKTFDNFEQWLERRNNTSRAQSPKASEQINPYLIRALIEALLYTYGKIITPEAPYFSLFTFMNSREISLKGMKVPKLMFTVFNGGKGLGSKVKFSTFYLIIDI